jgi:hypothetical protein
MSKGYAIVYAVAAAAYSKHQAVPFSCSPYLSVGVPLGQGAQINGSGEEGIVIVISETLFEFAGQHQSPCSIAVTATFTASLAHDVTLIIHAQFLMQHFVEYNHPAYIWRFVQEPWADTNRAIPRGIRQYACATLAGACS